MSIDEIKRLQVLAGIKSARILEDEQAADPDVHSKEGDEVDGKDESNVSITGSEKGKYMRDNNIKPGSDEWFKLWFAKPLWTGENPMPKRNKK